MKQRLSFPVLLSFVLLFTASCTRSGSNSLVNDVTPIVTNGNWVVSLFSERGVAETNDFAGYSFVFQSDGKLIANRGGVVVKEGRWSEDRSSGKLIINLGIKDNTNKPLGELTDDWILTGKSDNKISMTDDNASRNELLEFSKN